MSKNDFDKLKRLVDRAEGPLEQFRKQQELFERINPQATAAAEIARQMQEQFPPERMRSVLDAVQAHSGFTESVRALIERPGFYEIIEQQKRQAEKLRKLIEDGLLPSHQRLAEVSQRLATQVDPFAALALSEADWSDQLRRQMQAMTTPWVDQHLQALSFEGFAVVSRIGQTLRAAPAFDEAAREELDDDIGDAIEVDDDAGPDERDAAHVAAGMEASLFAITPAGFGEVLLQTGIVLKSEYLPIPKTTDGANPGLMFNPGHNLLITTVEQNLREFIDGKMIAEFGENWPKQRVHGDVVKEWRGRREVAVAKGEAPFRLIQYSNFMELGDIVIRRGHWEPLFAPVFKNPIHFQTAMQRLHPIRVPLAHSRPIGRGQELTLISEAEHVLGALGINILRRE